MSKAIDELLELQKKRITFRKRFEQLEEEMRAAMRTANFIELKKINNEYAEVLKEYKKLIGGFKE